MFLGVAMLSAVPLLLDRAPAQTFWTDEDQTKYQKASADFHAASYGLPSPQDGSSSRRRGAGYDPVAAKAKYEATKAEWEAQKSRLDGAQSRRTWLMWGVRLLGAAMAAIGLIGYFRLRGQSQS